MILQRQCYPPVHLVIDGNTWNEMEEAVQSAYPEEACGILLGCRETGTVDKAVHLENRAGKDMSGWYYRIDPLDLYRLECRIENEGYDMIGVYHSHADAEAILSDEDEENMIPGMIYTILPVFDGKPGRIRAYWKIGMNGKTTEISIKLEERAAMKIYISATLRNFFGRNPMIDIPGESISAVLDNLADEYPEGRKVLFDDSGELRRFVQIYIGEENRTAKEYRNVKLPSETEILLLPAIAGGSLAASLIPDERRKAVLLDDSEVERFGRHLLLKDIGVKGQKRIKAARVVVAGAGALGSPVIQYLAAAGVGTIKVVDFDDVSLENLQSQVLHTTRDLKRPKVASAKDKVRNINRNINLEAENIKLEADNIVSVIDGYDLVIDCTDNYKARYLISDACVLCGIPEVFGAIYQFEGQVGIFNLGGGPCYRCQFPEPPETGLVPTCAEGGAISPLPGIIGSIQANEALKLIMGIGEHLDGKLLVIDSLYLQSRILRVRKNLGCPVCGANAVITAVEDYDYEDFCGLKDREEEIPIEGLTPEELAGRIENGPPVTLVDVREPHERSILRFPGAIVIPIGQLARRKNELNPEVDTVFICKEGKRSILAINTLREAGYAGPMYNLKGGLDAMKDIIFTHEGAWL